MPAFGGLHAKLGVLPSNGSNDIAVYKAFFVSQLSVLSKIVQNSSLPPPDGNGKINSLVRLDIPGPVLARLLAYMYPQARGLPFLTLELLEMCVASSTGRCRPLTSDFDSLHHSFCLTGERYGLQTTIQRSHGALFVEAHSPTVLALAILYDLPELVSVALPHFDNPKDRDVTTRPRGWTDRISLWEVGDKTVLGDSPRGCVLPSS